MESVPNLRSNEALFRLMRIRCESTQPLLVISFSLWTPQSGELFDFRVRGTHYSLHNGTICLPFMNGRPVNWTSILLPEYCMEWNESSHMFMGKALNSLKNISIHFLHPASATDVIVLALSVCLCVCVSRSQIRTVKCTALNFGM